MYKIGDKVVHLSLGVGEVTGIESRTFSPDKVTKFYIVTIQDNGTPKKVFVDADAGINRLRRPISKQKVNDLLAALRAKGAAIDNQTWNRRYRDYMERIHTGDIFQIAEVVKALFALRADKDLSFGERKLLDQAKRLIVAECAAATGKAEDYFDLQLEEIFK
jgi:CarD family transcriptional regulator